MSNKEADQKLEMAAKEKVASLKAAFAASPAAQMNFASLEKFLDHMLRADYHSSPVAQAEFHSPETWSSYARWIDRKGA